MSLYLHLAQWIDPFSDPAVTLTREQRASLVLLGRTGLLPQCLPVAAAAGSGKVQLVYGRYPGDYFSIRVTMDSDGDLVSLERQYVPREGEGAPGEWKLDVGELWGDLKSATQQD